MENPFIRLVRPNMSLAYQIADYYQRNKQFLEKFEPVRDETFYSPEHQQELIEKEIADWKAKTSFRFYIQLVQEPHSIIGAIGLNNIIWGPFCSAFLGYKLDKDFHLHCIEANVMPKNKASLKVLENYAMH